MLSLLNGDDFFICEHGLLADAGVEQLNTHLFANNINNIDVIFGLTKYDIYLNNLDPISKTHHHQPERYPTAKF